MKTVNAIVDWAVPALTDLLLAGVNLLGGLIPLVLVCWLGYKTWRILTEHLDH